MNYSPQFKLSTLIGWVAAAAFLSVLLFDRSLYGTLVAAFGISALVGIECIRLRLHLVASGAIAGFVFPSCVLVAYVAETIDKAEMIQGQLYYEDGPATFFAVTFFLLLLFGFYGALIGSSFGCIAHFVKICFSRKCPTGRP